MEHEEEGEVDEFAHIEDACERADAYKGAGNRALKKSPASAVAQYSKALEVRGVDDARRAVYLSNRAAAHLVLQNWRSALEDARASFNAAPSVKAAYRAARAASGSHRWAEAKTWVDKALDIEPSARLHALQAVVEERIRAELRAQDDREERQVDKKEALKLFLDALGRRGWTLGKKMPYPTHFNDSKSIGIRYDDIKDIVYFPVILFYPQFRQTDMVDGVSERSTLLSTLTKMFPPGAPPLPFDRRGVLRHENMRNWRIMVKTNDFENKTLVSKWIPLDPKQTYAEIFSTPEYVIPKWPCIFIFTADWDGAKQFLNEI